MTNPLASSLRGEVYSLLSQLANREGDPCGWFREGHVACWCPGRDLNPHSPCGEKDFKSFASADFATRAYGIYCTRRISFPAQDLSWATKRSLANPRSQRFG